MNDREAGVETIRANPGDDLPRLVFADYLDTHGEPERAELIRLQCRIAELRRDCWCGACVKLRGGGQHHNGRCAIDQDRHPGGGRTHLRKREYELFETFCREDMAVAFGLTPHETLLPTFSGLVVPGLAIELVFHRGFPVPHGPLRAFWVDQPLGPGSHGGRIHGQSPRVVGLFESEPIDRVEVADRTPRAVSDSMGKGWTWTSAWGAFEHWLPDSLRERLPREKCQVLSRPGYMRWDTEADARAALSAAILGRPKRACSPSNRPEGGAS